MNVVLPYYIISYPTLKSNPLFPAAILIRMAQVCSAMGKGLGLLPNRALSASVRRPSANDDRFKKHPPLSGDYPYLFSRVAGQSHWPSLQPKPPHVIGLLPSLGANKPVRCQAFPGLKHSDAQIRTGFPLSCHSEPKPFTALRINSAEAKNPVFAFQERDSSAFGLRMTNAMLGMNLRIGVLSAWHLVRRRR
jgi:hypothetical protein